MAHLTLLLRNTFLFVLMYTPLLFAISGTIQTDTTWSGAVTVTGDIIVDSAQLTIAPGTIVKFDTTNDNIVKGDASHIKMVVTQNGVINAIGTKGQKITFTSLSSSPDTGSWGGITLSGIDSTNATTFKYCVVQYSVHGFSVEKNNTTNQTSSVTLDYCTISKAAQSGITATDSSVITIDHCTIYDCEKGILLNAVARATISYSTVYNTSVGIINLGDSTATMTSTINHITMYNIDSTLTSGQDAWKGYGIWTGNDSSVANLTNSIITTTDKTGLFIDSNWSITNDYNCWFNNLSNIENGVLGSNSITSDPMLYDPVNGDFRLISGSACINTAGDSSDRGAIQENHPPQITSSASLNATEDNFYLYQLTVIDDDMDTLSYTLVQGPNDMGVSNSGFIIWAPRNEDVGTVNIIVKVLDGRGGEAVQSYTLTVINVNDPPKLSLASGSSIDEDSLYQYDVDASDVDAGDTVLIYSLDQSPDSMTIDSLSGLISWTPRNEDVGVETVAVRVIDGNGGIDSMEYVLTIINTNDAPTITSVPPITSVFEESLYQYDVQASDVDVGDTILIFSLMGKPDSMTIDSATGLILWTPHNVDVGTETVVVKVQDGNNGLDSQEVVITVFNTNDPPVITSLPDTSVFEDSLYLYNVIINDPDLQDTVHLYSLILSPDSMQIDSTTGAITWIPLNKDVGVESTMVRVQDGNGAADSQQIIITIYNTNDDPVITSIPADSVYEDSLYQYVVQTMDMDTGDSVFIYSLVTAPGAMGIDSVNGILSWTPSNTNVGIETVVVKAKDENGGQTTQQFYVTVLNTNDPPVLDSVAATTVDEDSLYQYDINASDVDVGDSLIYSLLIAPDSMVMDSTTGLITWMPLNADVGTESVTVKADDRSGGTDTLVMVITVNNTNDAPAITSPPLKDAYENDVYSFNIMVNEVDVGDTLVYSLLLGPASMTIDTVAGILTWTPLNADIGTVSVKVKVVDRAGEQDSLEYDITIFKANGKPIITSLPPPAQVVEDSSYQYKVAAIDPDVEDSILIYSFAVAPGAMTIDSLSGVINWIPRNADVGSTSITVQANDGKNGIATQTFGLTILNSNDFPVITSTPVATTPEDSLYKYLVAVTDVDVGDTALVFRLLQGPDSMQIDSLSGLITWLPLNSDVGAESVVVKVEDGNGGVDSQAFVLTIVNINDIPVIASSPPVTATEESLYQYDVNASDIDAGDTVLIYRLSTGPSLMQIDSLSGLVSWLPQNSDVGLNNVVVTVVDGNGGVDTQAYVLTVANINDAPVIVSTAVITATEESLYQYDVNGNDVDAGDTVLVYRLVQSPGTMVIDSLSGMLSWLPQNSDVGMESVLVTLDDGNGGVDSQFFVLTIININDAPVIGTTPSVSAFEDSLYLYDVNASDVDAGDTTLVYRLARGPDSMQIDSLSGLISWLSMNKDVGVESVLVIVSDGNGGADSQAYILTVTNINDAPIIQSTAPLGATEESLYTYDVNASDVDAGDTMLVYRLLSGPAAMQIDSLSGVISWLPQNSDVGTESVLVTVHDGDGGMDSQSFQLIVININDFPVITSLAPLSVMEDSLYQYDVNGTDMDKSDTMLVYRLVKGPDSMRIDSLSGMISWLPLNSDVGTESLLVIIDDGNGGVDSQAISLTIINTNDTPIIGSTAPAFATEEILYTYDVNASDVDVGDTVLVYRLARAPDSMRIDSLSGLISWLPLNSDVGAESVEVIVEDGNNGIFRQLFILTIKNTNDYPSIYSTAIISGTEDGLYQYLVKANDVDGDTLVYHLIRAPAGMSIDSSRGLLSWVPGNNDSGSNAISVEVSDGEYADTQHFKIYITFVNDAPVFKVSNNADTVVTGQVYTFLLDVYDEEKDSLIFSILDGPPKIKLLGNVLLLVPTNEDSGNYNVKIEVSDGNSADTLLYPLYVQPVIIPKEIIIDHVNLVIGPNPSRDVVNVNLNLLFDQKIKISVMDYNGIKVASLLNRSLAKGKHRIVWKPNNASGFYFIKFEAQYFSRVQRVLWIKY